MRLIREDVDRDTGYARVLRRSCRESFDVVSLAGEKSGYLRQYSRLVIYEESKSLSFYFGFFHIFLPPISS
jgi:hypothetical protein